MLSRPTGECNLANPEDIPQTQETDMNESISSDGADEEGKDIDIDEGHVTVELAYFAEDT